MACFYSAQDNLLLLIVCEPPTSEPSKGGLDDSRLETHARCVRLGIGIERIKPGSPQENGRHERMHRTLKQETTRPPGANSVQQQARFDAFVSEFNDERPHEALAMRCPAELYAPSPTLYQGLPEVEYPFHDCALYTRKSSEEGLEQGFNSLDAQREACAAYVKSQAGEGWRSIEAPYDDGGFSGGSMERPALQRLMEDIASGKVDVVVVYKIDRLTRSLADFARMVELFDRHGVSFVSVTQAFNTTSSMGRLTLNVLLSFAQFEQEVTGERIRDKIAASKAKGMWMGGTLPLGYDLPREGGRILLVNEPEAETVRCIFQTYLELQSVLALERRLDGEELRSKRRITEGQGDRRSVLQPRRAVPPSAQSRLSRHDRPQGQG